MPKMIKSGLADQFEGSFVCLISCLSFEERSLTVSKNLSGNGLQYWYCFYNGDIETSIDGKIEQAQNLGKVNDFYVDLIRVEKRNPLSFADRIYTCLEQAFTQGRQILIDITTMTHEMVLVTVAALDELDQLNGDAMIVYNIASEYSSAERDRDRKWISRGIHGVRSVIGYSGLWSPGSPTCLLALPGFDLERVQRIAEELEPDELIVGIGLPSHDLHGELTERNRLVANALLSSVRGATFEYTSIDPTHVAMKSLEAVKNFRGNILVAPLNSKPSTFAIGLLSRHKVEWQVCYAPALVYNVSYSIPSNSFFLSTVAELNAEVRSLCLAEIR